MKWPAGTIRIHSMTNLLKSTPITNLQLQLLKSNFDRYFTKIALKTTSTSTTISAQGTRPTIKSLAMTPRQLMTYLECSQLQCSSTTQLLIKVLVFQNWAQNQDGVTRSALQVLQEEFGTRDTRRHGGDVSDNHNHREPRSPATMSGYGRL